MQVKDLLIEALSRANHIQRGFAADASEITTALQHFNSQIRKYSDANMITAFQKVLDFTQTRETTVIGAPTPSKGVRIHWITSSAELPNLTDFDPNTNPMGLAIARDIFVTAELAAQHLVYYIQYVGQGSGHYFWNTQSCSTYFALTPNVIQKDMERIMAAMIKNDYDEWVPMQYVPLTHFYTDDRNLIYTTTSAGESKINFTIKSNVYNKEIKLVYNSNMKFDKNDYLELPDAHIELLVLATTCALLKEDCDSDQSQLNNYMTELKELENQISEQATSTRTIYREFTHKQQSGLDMLFSGSFLTR